MSSELVNIESICPKCGSEKIVAGTIAVYRRIKGSSAFKEIPIWKCMNCGFMSGWIENFVM